jgi:hypothetical protein
MSDTPDTPVVQELDLLKERAKTLGINFHPSISAEKLKERIKDTMEGKKPEPEAAPAVAAEPPAPRPETKQEIRDRLHRECMALVRCRIYNLNPQKNDLRGEIITVANRYVGTVRKFIPFGEATEGGYHIPKIIYDDLKERRFQQVRTKNVKGQIQVETRMVPEYNIEVLPMLTEEELKELALRQAAAERVGVE